MAQTETSQPDYFDLIPNEILLSILNKIIDSKSLVRCLVLSRRFSSLVPQVDSLSITVPAAASPHISRRSRRTALSRLLRKTVTKPVVRLLSRLGFKTSQRLDSGRNRLWSDAFNVINEIKYLKNFSNVHSLRLVLPPNRLSDSDSEDSHFLHWRAEFGKELRRCTIVAADSITPTTHDEHINIVPCDDPVVPSDDLKRKLLCIISTLLAASARHTLMKRMITASPGLTSATIADARNEGEVIMEEEGIGELREWMSGFDDQNAEETMVLRTCLPDVAMRVWCAEELVLEESGMVLKGAIVATVMAAAEGKEVVEGGEGEGVVWEVVREMRRCRRKKGLRLEMNSF
ncbi:hypothetical protein Droror1_Dr00008831 [Drosera rotundifolia]